MFTHGIFMLFVSLGVGYALCVLAKRQEGLLKTLGYTLGIAILVFSLLYGLALSQVKLSGPGGPFSKTRGSIAKPWCPFVK